MAVEIADDISSSSLIQHRRGSGVAKDGGCDDDGSTEDGTEGECDDDFLGGKIVDSTSDSGVSSVTILDTVFLFPRFFVALNLFEELSFPLTAALSL